MKHIDIEVTKDIIPEDAQPVFVAESPAKVFLASPPMNK